MRIEKDAEDIRVENMIRYVICYGQIGTVYGLS